MKKIILLLFLVFVFGEFIVFFSSRLPFSPPAKKQINVPAEISACKTSTQKDQCWSDLITRIVTNQGVDKALEVTANLYDSEKSFASPCHAITHAIGQTAYELFAKHQDFTVTAKTAYCSYGFYHGFMEALVSKTNNPKLAREFCSYVDKQLKDKAPDAYLQCFHGIGHGWSNIHDTRLWGKEDEIINQSLTLCKNVSGTRDELTRCATGVFNNIALAYMSHEYNLSVNKDDPLTVCHKQTEEFKDPCYISMNITLLWFTNNDFAKAAAFLEKLQNTDMAIHAMRNLAAVVGAQNMNLSDHSAMIANCRNVQNRLQDSCFQGYAFGFLEHGQPEVEYVKPLAFCESQTLSKTEQQNCLSYIFSYLPQWYPRTKAESICQTVSTEYVSQCQTQVRMRYEQARTN
jgi:hypothetical protein